MKIRLDAVIKSLSVANAAIKNTASPIAKDGWYPAFSASGQDVWLPDYRFDHKGIVVSAVGARCGKAFKADGKWNICANTHALSVDESIADRDYCWYILNNETWWIKGGTVQPFVKVKDSLKREHLFPSLDEQSRIVQVLDQVSYIIDMRQKELLSLDNMTKARFVEMFGEPVSNPKGWVIFPWERVFDTRTGKLDSNASVKGGSYPFFTCAKEWLWIDKYAYDCEALLLAGNNAAGVYDVKHYKGKFNAYQRTYILQLKNADWSYSLFKYQLEDKLQYLQSQSKGTNTRYLTMGILNSLSFIVPPRESQDAFTAFVAQADKSKVAVQKALDEAQLLFDSLMQQYFG